MIRLFLAPIAGITKFPFRKLLWKEGIDYAYTEMVSGIALFYRDPKSLSLIDIGVEERAVGVQLVGGDPEKMAEGAKIAERWGAASIDINMGCPARKVLGSGGGAKLLLDVNRALEIFLRVRDAVSVPVSVKLRKGWKGRETFLEISKRLEKEGVSWITLHARCVEDGFSSPPDWKSIKVLKESVSVPVVGNGGVNKPEDALRMVEETGCDAVMLARGVLRNPFLPRQIRELEEKGSYRAETPLEKVKWFLDLCSEARNLYGDINGAKYVKSLIPWVLKEIRGASWLRGYLLRMESLGGMESVLREVVAKMSEGGKYRG